jgi:hypothetical protein
MAPVLLDFEEAFGAKRHLALMHKVYETKFYTNVINLISSFLSTRKPALSGEIQAVVPRSSVMSPTLNGMYINDTPNHQVFIWPSLSMTFVCKPQFTKTSYVLRKLQRILNSIET